MKKLGLLLCTLLATGLLPAKCASAQNVGDNSVYFVLYYSNANTAGAPDQVVRLVNDGDQATGISKGVENGTLWAAFYVFDNRQEFQACCACQITADGLLSESVNTELTADEFSTRAETTTGVVKIISSSSSDPTAPVPAPGLRGWATHIQGTTNSPASGPWYVTESRLADSNLGKTELNNLGNLCNFALWLSDGYSKCPCTAEGSDF